MGICDVHMIAMSKIHEEICNDSIVCMIHDTHDVYNDIWQRITIHVLCIENVYTSSG